MKLITYSNDNDKLFEFNFNNPLIQYNSKMDLIEVIATKQKIYICGNAFIAYDEEILIQPVDAGWVSAAQNWIQTFYKNNESCLLISSHSNKPIMLFHGKEISLKSKDTFYKFQIDNHQLLVYNCNFLVLSHKNPN